SSAMPLTASICRKRSRVPKARSAKTCERGRGCCEDSLFSGPDFIGHDLSVQRPDCALTCPSTGMAGTPVRSNILATHAEASRLITDPVADFPRLLRDRARHRGAHDNRKKDAEIKPSSAFPQSARARRDAGGGVPADHVG